MFPTILLSIVVCYFLVLLAIAFYTSRHSNNESFFIGNRSSKWWVVAFGMVGTSLSGITFISVPGTVGRAGFDYFQVVIGYVIGYFAVAFILLPIYYNLRLTSIYTYLKGRFGMAAYKTGALFFLISRTLGATLRLYLVIKVLEKFVLQSAGISFEFTAVAILALILLYTYRGGVRTIVWTDTLQTSFMLLALLACSWYIIHTLSLTPGSAWGRLSDQGFTRMIGLDPKGAGFFLKQVIGGAFITIAMTGLDQEMMQKNISVNNLRNAQKNMITMSFLQAFAVFIFLSLGGLLYIFAMHQGAAFVHTIKDGKDVTDFVLNGVTIPGDDLFPFMAFHYLPPALSIIFIIGLISALFPSADGALTALTSSFCIDILGLLDNTKTQRTENSKKKIRLRVHYSFAFLFLVCVFFFRIIDNGSIVQVLLVIAGYTYGPLLALFAFGIFTGRTLRGIMVPVVCIAAPALCYVLREHDSVWLGGYHIGNELLAVNALLTFIFLWCISVRKDTTLVS